MAVCQKCGVSYFCDPKNHKCPEKKPNCCMCSRESRVVHRGKPYCIDHIHEVFAKERDMEARARWLIKCGSKSEEWANASDSDKKMAVDYYNKNIKK